ncbi:MAG: thiamine pyrophosphate-binding protein [Elusimicrobiota bacterium]
MLLTKKTVVRVILDGLKQEGVSHCFGIPGGAVTPFFDALYDERGIRTIASRHEAGAAFMAAGYARLSGRLGVCCATTGPGTTNLMTGIAAARSDGLPVLAITAQVSTAHFGRGSLQDSTDDKIDVVRMMKAVAKSSVMLVNPSSAASLLRQLIRTAMSGRKGPVHLNIPCDLMKLPVAASPLWPVDAYRVQSRFCDHAAVADAIPYLLEAKKPAILAGHGVHLSNANVELLELAERWSIPVATTPRGKGAFPESHPLSLGVFGLASSVESQQYLLAGDVDVLLVLGSSLHEMSTQGWDPLLNPTRALIQADIDPCEIGRNYPVTVGIVGDLGAVLREMLNHSQGCAIRPFDFPAVAKQAEFAKSQDQSVPLKPQRLFWELRRCLPEDAVIFVDVGNATLWSLHCLKIDRPNSFINNWGDFAAMGYATAGAIGGKLASPHRAVVAIVGDGAFAMMGMEVLTAATYDIPVIWIVLNDGRLNTVYHGQQLQYAGRHIATEFHRMDISKIAEGLGALAATVERPNRISEVLNQMLDAGRPAVIDVRIDADEIPPIESRVRALERSFAAV